MKNSSIEWTDHTFNPWEGCTKVSPGCAHCYAETRNARFGGGTAPNWGKGAPRRRASESYWEQPIKWEREAARDLHEFNATGVITDDSGAVVDRGYRPPRVFCASVADWLDDEVPIEWLADLLDLIRRTPHLDWLLLTKRAQNWLPRMTDAALALPEGHETRLMIADWLSGHQPASLWIGTSVEDQERADERIPMLLTIPARVHFLSCEPLLGPVDLTRIDDDGVAHLDALRGCAFCDGRNAPLPTRRIDWVICGGESGHNARPMLIEWADDLRRQCDAAGIAFFAKQLGAHVCTTNANAHDWPDNTEFSEVPGTPQYAGARVILRDKKGGCIDEFPAELRIREFPIQEWGAA